MFVIVFLCSIFPITNCISDRPLLLLVALDGFRYDYLDKAITPNLWELSQEGVQFENGVKSQMITNTSPNFYSILTGLYTESHGIVGNVFADPIIGDYFDYWNFTGHTARHRNSRKSHWYTGEPIWLTNQKFSGFSGSMRFPTGDATIYGNTASEFQSWQDFGQLSDWKRDLDHLLEWFTRSESPVNLGLFYIGEPDGTQHSTGTLDSNSTQTLKILKDLDKFIAYMIRALKKRNLWERMNLILTADHGHVDTPYPSHFIPIDDFLNKIPEYHGKMVLSTDGLSLIGISDSLNIDSVILRLTTALEEKYKNQEVTVWKTQDFPKHYHCTKNRRIGQIILMPKFGYSILHNITETQLLVQPQQMMANHGYFPEVMKMRAFLVMRGPAFKKNFRVELDIAENIDLYPLMCKVLRIRPAANNGSLWRVEETLVQMINSALKIDLPKIFMFSMLLALLLCL